MPTPVRLWYRTTIPVSVNQGFRSRNTLSRASPPHAFLLPRQSVRIHSFMSNPIEELLNSPIPEKLWHYTSIQGFHGIVTSKRIFATDVRFLNDREEFVHARKIADQIVAVSPEFDADGFPYRKHLATAVTLAFDSGPLSDIQVFVASFSAAEDQLGQWRGYSQGSSGVSLAFDLRSFRPPPDVDTLVSFAPCVYDEHKKQELLADALHHCKEEISGYWQRTFRAACERNPEMYTAKDKEKVVREFLNANPNQKASDEDFRVAVTKTRVDCLRVAALLKNPSFQEENEWRLVLPTMMHRLAPMNNPPQFRIGKTTLIPYITHPFSAKVPFPLDDIILGPGSDENSIFAARRFLTLQGLNLPPRLSKVPYRAT
jgi:Protein of unknown function (DUF2971)